MSHATTGSFESRHIGPSAGDRDEMLAIVGAPSLEALMDEAIPRAIRLREPLDLPEPETEYQFLNRLRALAQRNLPFRSLIGLGYSGCVTPPVILRNVLEDPSWYTSYTPYQAEIAQGRLEALLVFQTLVEDLTGMPVANASLLDEPTAAAEAMTMLRRVHGGTRSVFLASSSCAPQTLDVLRGRAEPLGIQLDVVAPDAMAFDDRVFGVLLQTPDARGLLCDVRAVIGRAHSAGALAAVATDLLALVLATPPGEMGADVVVGSAQRFGVPMGYGGPHAAFFATRAEFVRQVPGRIIGVSIDAHGNRAYRMALQTREQHIRRDKATSNICTAQALLATMAAMYAVYHGPDGLVDIASRVHAQARQLDITLAALGVTQVNGSYFDTLRLDVPAGSREAIRQRALEHRYNFYYPPERPNEIQIAVDETVAAGDLEAIQAIFAAALGRPASPLPACGEGRGEEWPAALRRATTFLQHPVFHAHRSETAMMRYLQGLERKDIGLDVSMIPLGSCTMKLNSASVMEAVSWPEFGGLHPFAPVEQAGGYAEVIAGLESALAEITGFPAVSLQPNSGAQGEFTGLMVIRAYHLDRGEPQRNVVLIPASAHGTNPASAVMAGMKVVVVACDEDGDIDVADLEARAAQHQDFLAALMITYPSTHGVFEDAVRDICAIVHGHGGQVYMDGANMNAQVGLTSPAAIGADVCHLNLHKTFAIPHGGGGPGVGPIAVAAHLAPYLPGHVHVGVGREKAIPAVAGAPWGSASILLISYGYICLLGAEGLMASTRYAILNANYVKARLQGHYPVLYANPNGRVAHELIFDMRGFKAHGIDEQDIAKRLMDYGFHAPTVSFPVAGTLMVEPTESEPKAELDRFCEALIAIKGEIQEVVDGRADAKDNLLKNAPHTMSAAAADAWPHPYSRERAVFPLPFVREHKFWPSVGRIDNPYGDRHLVCACPPLDAYASG
ncbi:MAG: aminomethyl-transferring glycine dehydrogenase [Acidobacteriota bacterium]